MSPGTTKKKKATGAAPASGTFALTGRVVTMNAAFDVIDPGTVYVQDGTIVAVQPAAAPPPPGFAGVTPLASGGAIFPGLIELHNHLAYNALTLWKVPKLYRNRDQWRGTDDYETLISRPMGLIGNDPHLVLAICRYVQCKCLLGGVTTSQGIRLVADPGIAKYFRGVIRTVEQPVKDPRLPAAAALISDPDAVDPQKFLKALQKQDAKGASYLLHLSEGTDDAARQHFLSLHVTPDTWAIDRALAGIHCAALKPADFAVLAANHGAMVWSPFSNLLLYGKTADVAAAKSAGVLIGLGPDWSPSGSKSLFGELKIAKLYSDNNGGIFTARELVAMATRDAAAILRWERALGSLEAGKRADLLVVKVGGSDPYAGLIAAKETAIRLVVVDGVARYGMPDLVAAFRDDAEAVKVGGLKRALNLLEAPGDPEVAALSFKQAADALRDALHRLPEIQAGTAAPVTHALAAAVPQPEGWTLALDEQEDTAFDLRPHLPVPGRARATGAMRLASVALAAQPIVLKPLLLDPPTVADDAAFLPLVAQQINLPSYLRDGLAALYA